MLKTKIKKIKNKKTQLIEYKKKKKNKNKKKIRIKKKKIKKIEN